MKRNNKTWIRQLSESYIRQALKEDWDVFDPSNFRDSHDELRKKGTTSFHYMSSPHVEHFGIKSTGRGGWETDPVINHPEHGPLQVERTGDRYILTKFKLSESYVRDNLPGGGGSIRHSIHAPIDIHGLIDARHAALVPKDAGKVKAILDKEEKKSGPFYDEQHASEFFTSKYYHMQPSGLHMGEWADILQGIRPIP